MLRLTLDTSGVIHSVARRAYAADVDGLVELAREGVVALWVSGAFGDDQSHPNNRHEAENRAWLEARPFIGVIATPFRLNHSRLGRGDVLSSAEYAQTTSVIERILLPPRFQPGNVQAETTATAQWARRLHDVQHLSAHVMAGHDAFVTSDEDDMLKRRDRLLAEAGVRVLKQHEALMEARGASTAT